MADLPAIVVPQSLRLARAVQTRHRGQPGEPPARHARLPPRREGAARARARRHPRHLPRARVRRDRDARHGGQRPPARRPRRRQREARVRRAEARAHAATTCRRPKEPLDLVDLGLRFDLTVPLARFYATHRAELPAVFRSIQIAPVWRAERPQKGRYRQFVQCDIDIMGEPGIAAEAELLTATLATVDALGLGDASIRINDRRLLIGMLEGFGFAAAEQDAVLITIDKLDKIGPGRRDRRAARARGHRRRPSTRSRRSSAARRRWSSCPSARRRSARRCRRIRMPPSSPTSRRSATRSAPERLTFDPFLVRGMGYYTGPIFELAHPSVDYSLGGGGRYDGMIGRFLGSRGAGDRVLARVRAARRARRAARRRPTATRSCWCTTPTSRWRRCSASSRR